MARFDLYRPPRITARADNRVSFVVDVQSPHLDHMETRIVIPVLARQQVRPVSELHPVIHIEGGDFVLMTHALASIMLRDLGHPVASLIEYRDAIARALDILITGF